MNSIDDFCVGFGSLCMPTVYADASLVLSAQIWGAPFANVTVAEDEEQLVAYCTTPNHGTRVLPEGTLQGVQFTKTPGYVQVVGFLDQTQIGLQADDYGGEEVILNQSVNPLCGHILTSIASLAGPSRSRSAR